MNSKIKAVAFDLGGVLFLEGKAIAIPRISRAFNLPEDQILSVLTSPLSNQVRRGEKPEEEFWTWAQKTLSLPDTNSVTRLREMWYEGYEIDQGVVDVISNLRKNGCKTIAFTGNIPSRILWLEKRYSFERLFDHHVYSYDYKGSKTMPEFHRAMLQVAQCEPEQVLFIDDEERHTKTASSLGIHSFVYKTGDIASLKSKLHELGLL